MEEWKAYYHLAGGRCFEMYFKEIDQIIKFKIVGLDSFGNRAAINYETVEKVDFNTEQLLKVE